MHVLTIVVEVSMFKIFKILKLFCLQCNGLNSFYLSASVCVVAVWTICNTDHLICEVELRRAGAECKIIEKLAKCAVFYRPQSWHVTNRVLDIHHVYLFIH